MVVSQRGWAKIVVSNFLVAVAVGLVAVSGLSPLKAQESSKASAADVAPHDDATERRGSAELLPSTTRFWISIEDLRRLETNIANTQIGKLARQDTLAPFFASFEQQIRDSLDKNGIKFGLDVSSVEGLETNEVSLAGILPDFEEGVKPTPGSHGIVVLIDVSPNVLAAEDFLDDAAEKMKNRGAKQEQIEVFEQKVSKFTIEVQGARIRRTQVSFVSIVDGWLVASDNQSIFTNVLRRIKSKKRASGVLSDFAPFVAVEERTQVKGVKRDFSWYVDPLGYVRFADQLAQQKEAVKTPKDRPIQALSNEGLNALEAIGGFVSFSTGEQDVLHRTLIYANPENSKNAKQKRLLALLDFAPEGWSVKEVPSWVPSNAAGYFSLTWDINKAFENVGPFFDTITGTEGAFEDILKSMKEQPGFEVDLRQLVRSFGNRITVVSITEEPIDEESEKMLIGIPIGEVDEEKLIEDIGRARQGEVKRLAGYAAVFDYETEPQEEGIPEFELELDDDSEDEEEAVEELPERITLFNRRIFAIRHGHLFICNDKEFLKKILSAKKLSDAFARSDDLKLMKQTLGELTNEREIRVELFRRLDRALKPDYEMLRTGRMAESETFLGRLLNRIYATEGKRKQHIDGSDLPADFEKIIAPYLGTSGLVMETTDAGWRVTGCILPKGPTKTVVAEVPDNKN